MTVRKEKINRELYGFLKSHGYKPQGFIGSGESSGIPEKADFFQFDFIYDSKNYGKVSVSIDGNGSLIVYSGDDVESSPKASTHDSISFTALKRYLSRFRHTKGLKSFQLSDTDDLEPDMKKREHDRTEGLNEGYYPINKRSSYSDSVPATKIILQHNRVMEEGDQRYRAIEKIFVENVQGERFLLPTTKPGLARVYARHIAEGGTPYDERGQHITGLCEEYSKMAGFVRATRNKQFNESAQSVINEGVNHYNHLRETLNKMSGKRGYTEYFNNYKPALLEDEASVDVSEMFMQSSLDPRIESVMPILGKLSKNISENKLKQVDELAEWADKVIEGRIDSMDDCAPDQLAEYKVQEEKIAGRYDPVEFDEKVLRLKALAKKNPADIEALARKLHAAMKADEKKSKDVAEDLDSNQKRVGQLGPTEKVKNNNIGKLVGANESAEKSATHKGGTVTKSSTVLKHQSGPGNYGGYDANRHPDSDEEKHTGERGAKAGHRTDKIEKFKVKEGQEDLNAILRIIKK